MALHGKIEVNGNAIGEWQAVRKERNPKTVNTYAVRVDYREPDGVRHTRHTTLEHTFGDGALTLAAQVLTWAAKQLPPKGLTADKGSVTVGT